MGNVSGHRAEFHAEDLEDQGPRRGGGRNEQLDLDEDDYDDEEEEETEEQWQARREGRSAQHRLDQIKRLLAIAFFAGLGIIVIVVAVTSAPLVTPADEPEKHKNANLTLSPTISHGL